MIDYLDQTYDSLTDVIEEEVLPSLHPHEDEFDVEAIARELVYVGDDGLLHYHHFYFNAEAYWEMVAKYALPTNDE